MINEGEVPRDLARLVVPLLGGLESTGDLFAPYRLVDGDGRPVAPVAAFFAELAACGRPATTQRSYGMDLLRWFRFLWAVGVDWDQATRVEARDFVRWLQVTVKPARPHWRDPSGDPPSRDRAAAGRVNAVTGKPSRGDRYEASTVAHCESVLRGFYDFHLEAGTGPMLNPFPLARHARPGRAHAHHNPMEPFDRGRRGRYRPKVVTRAPRSIPDDRFDALFARLGSHRDRALVAFWVSTGARASELLGATVGDVDPGQQLITVMRKGTRVLQPLPAAPNAFVWLRLYQAQLFGLVPAGRDEPLWRTLRRPLRPLGYDATRAMFTRANAGLDANWTLHDLRHTAAYRMARDPGMPLTDIQWVLGHAHLSTTQRYLNQPSGIAPGGREPAGGQVSRRAEWCGTAGRGRRLTRVFSRDLLSDA
ncbi:MULTISPECIES: site-specific integrase [unclassified Pseudofrankia]|uniref:tyrosine-type recombinase/integrase n=1 Tax=unclassified Pseudofrankia TaxID=2994372 RepID=UPI000921AEDF|nr:MULTISPECIES: site-specific integrase [unclassified Pseudofrankia]OHV63077.1 integrase [Pseudofrankia sp. BMG5.36]